MSFAASVLSFRERLNPARTYRQWTLFRLGMLIGCLSVLSIPAVAGPIIEFSTSDDESTVYINDAPEQDVIVIGKSVVVTKQAKGVLAIGGDVIIEGRVSGDVATLGGNIIQRHDAFVGGDVIAIGGAYKPENPKPLRTEGRETIMFGVFEEELRSFGRDPSQIFAPSMTLTFLAQRVLLAFFWFAVSFIFATVAPGAVGRAVARIQLSLLKVSAIGAAAFLLLIGSVVTGVLTLPDYLSVTLGFMGSLLLLLSYVFGRVALQLTVGKLIQKHFLSVNNRSETLAILIGVAVVTIVLSLPYIWVVSLFAVFIVGIGLVLTGRSNPTWQNP
ncbi:MAG: hypothetical protein WKF34_12650 [Pyrinomonadaceae bacterium]